MSQNYDARVIEPILFEIKSLHDQLTSLRKDVSHAFELIYNEYDKMVDEDGFNDFSSKHGAAIGDMQSKLAGLPLSSLKEMNIDTEMLDPEGGMKGMWEYMKGKQGEEGFDMDADAGRIIEELGSLIAAQTGVSQEEGEAIAEQVVEDETVVEEDDPHSYFEQATKGGKSKSPYDE